MLKLGWKKIKEYVERKSYMESQLIEMQELIKYHHFYD